MTAPSPYKFFALPLSLYSGKVRCYLRNKQIPFQELPPTHPDHVGTVVPTVGRVVLPTILTPDGKVLQDTTEIIDTLEETYRDVHNAPVVPADPVLGFLARLLECFGDEGMSRPAMHYRWNFLEENEPFLSYEFARAMDHKADLKTARAMAGPVMANMQSYLPLIGVTDATKTGIEDEYRATLVTLNAHLRDHPYMLGGKPSAADYGLIGPLFAHLGRDPYPATLMKREASHVFRWVERMNAPGLDVPELRGETPSLLQADALPDSLIDVLACLQPSVLPELLALYDHLNDFVAKNSDVEAGTAVKAGTGAGGLGSMNVTFKYHTVTIIARPFSAWKLERALTLYRAAPKGAQTLIEQIMEKAGLGALLSLSLTRPIIREQYREIWG